MVSLEEHYTRLSYAAKFLSWLAYRTLESTAQNSDDNALKRIGKMREEISAKRPTRSKGSQHGKGLREEEEARVLAVSASSSPDNPFLNTPVRHRNELVIQLLRLGIRAGELLGLKVENFDWRTMTMTVEPRPHDTTDPRANPPRVKTLGRMLPISAELSEMVRCYVIEFRNKEPKARKHGFLIVTHSKKYGGAPLSEAALRKLIGIISKTVCDDERRISAHDFRHSANYHFSQEMDRRGVSENREEKLRSYYFGWKEGSGTAATYNRRHIEREARKAGLALQKIGKVK
mgnify:CR=1 FL=1|jgi:Site-specific recombinase XerD